MRQHRRTQDTVSNNLHDDNFDPADALESLHAAILRVATLVHVASEAADQVSYPSSRAARRAFDRMQILIGKAAEEAGAALAQGDELMAGLAGHLEAERARSVT
jgi:hypothetical protein